MMLRKLSILAAVAGLMAAGPVLAAGHPLPPKDVQWSFEGPFGKFDQAQLQRGYKVYREVCSACHSMSLISFRNLGDKGGPFYSNEHKNPNDNPWVKAIAKDYEVADIDSETGDAIKRPATSADRFTSPYANEEGGALYMTSQYFPANTPFRDWTGAVVMLAQPKLLFYVAYGESGVIKLDWSTVAAPSLMGIKGVVGGAATTAINNGRVYVAAGSGGLVVLKK